MKFIILIFLITFCLAPDFDDFRGYDDFMERPAATEAEADATPPDSFDTAPQYVRLSEDSVKITWNPSEIEAADVNTLDFTIDFVKMMGFYLH